MLVFRRVIETWFDPKYKEYFYTREPLARHVDMGDISEQLTLKKDLKCKTFDWFMHEVAYDIFEKYPPLPPNKMWGEMRNLANNFCLDTHGRHPPEHVSAGIRRSNMHPLPLLVYASLGSPHVQQKGS